MQSSVHTTNPEPESIAQVLRARRIKRAIGGNAAVSALIAELAFGALNQGWLTVPEARH